MWPEQGYIQKNSIAKFYRIEGITENNEAVPFDPEEAELYSAFIITKK